MGQSKPWYKQPQCPGCGVGLKKGYQPIKQTPNGCIRPSKKSPSTNNEPVPKRSAESKIDTYCPCINDPVNLDQGWQTRLQQHKHSRGTSASTWCHMMGNLLPMLAPLHHQGKKHVCFYLDIPEEPIMLAHLPTWWSVTGLPSDLGCWDHSNWCPVCGRHTVVTGTCYAVMYNWKHSGRGSVGTWWDSTKWEEEKKSRQMATRAPVLGNCARKVQDHLWGQHCDEAL